VNLPLALALFVIVWVHIESLRERHLGGYIKHYGKPAGWLTPINLIEEVTKPITFDASSFRQSVLRWPDNRGRGSSRVESTRSFEVIWKPSISLLVDPGVHIHVAHDHLPRYGDEPRG